MKNKAVILGSNYYIGLSVLRCLGENGVKTVAMDYSRDGAYGSESKYCLEKYVTPHYKNETEAFIDYLIDYAQKQEVKPVLYPCHDSYVEVVDAHLDLLREHYLISQQEQGLWTRLMNKDILHRIAQENGVLVPETVRVGDADFYEKIDEEIHYPCIVKPVDSVAFVNHFRKKIFLANNVEELKSAIEKSNEANLEVIVQRIIPGFDDHMHTYDAYLNQNSRVTHYTTCQKYRQYPINFGASVYTGQKNVPVLHEIGSKFLEAIRYKGFGEIEFKKDAETGEFYLIEINVRTTNLNSLLHKVGLNFPYIDYCELTGSPLPPKAVTVDTNRVFWYAFEDLLAVRDYLKTGQLKIGEVLKSYLKPKAFAVWSISDPKPGLVFWGILIHKAKNKLFKH